MVGVFAVIRAGFQNSMDSIINSVDLHNNDALEHAREHVREIVADARENGPTSCMNAV